MILNHLIHIVVQKLMDSGIIYLIVTLSHSIPHIFQLYSRNMGLDYFILLLHHQKSAVLINTTLGGGAGVGSCSLIYVVQAHEHDMVCTTVSGPLLGHVTLTCYFCQYLFT